MKKQVRKNKKRGISRETVMILTLNAFVLGILVEKIITNGFSWLSTIGYMG